MLKTIVTAAMTVLALADAPLQTGQTLSYDAGGNVVTYGTVKDDGYYRAGKARSYSRSGNVVMDNVTGLEWQDNESIKKAWDEFEGDTAVAYCDNLLLYYNNAYYYDWRLPNIEELQTLVNFSQYDPAVIEGLFNYIFSSTYWSSTTSARDSGSAWLIYFAPGISYSDDKNYNYYVRCVRGGQLAPFVRVRIGEIVSDGSTGLQWQDDTAAASTKVNWMEAIDYCENSCNLGGYDDWRLPNEKELLSIVDYSQYNPAIDYVFAHTEPSCYWSSTTLADYSSSAWNVCFSNGQSEPYPKSTDYYVRCVRGGQVNIPVNPSIIMYLLD